MAELPDTIKERIWNLIKQFLQILSHARRLEYAIVQQFGETPETLSSFEELEQVMTESRDYSNRLYTIILRSAEEPFNIPSDVLSLLEETIIEGEMRLPALTRSIQEVQRDWSV
ncbi:MAG: hypothetical protein DSM106950_19640 [Stigonema ocellatum SAG 48.90 = DSM 106950]|nr:hypothetical protein [Stigonema ocellatum SAG 48.90 = DSM 106950]